MKGDDAYTPIRKGNINLLFILMFKKRKCRKDGGI